MSVVELKHERVAAVLEREIRAGRVKRGTRLPGETALAERFAVSRNTVRSALSELSDAGLIATRIGKGSFVVYDGRTLDPRHGWARALAARGVDVQVRILDIAARSEPRLAARLGLNNDSFVLVTRVRQLADSTAISYERSFVAQCAELTHLPDAGLVDGSLTLTLAQAGLYEADGTQSVRARPIDAREARVLDRAKGEWFLDVQRTSWTSSHRLVEHVESLLDPRHFEVQVAWNR